MQELADQTSDSDCFHGLFEEVSDYDDYACFTGLYYIVVYFLLLPALRTSYAMLINVGPSVVRAVVITLYRSWHR